MKLLLMALLLLGPHFVPRPAPFRPAPFRPAPSRPMRPAPAPRPHPIVPLIPHGGRHAATPAPQGQQQAPASEESGGGWLWWVLGGVGAVSVVGIGAYLVTREDS